MIHPVTYHVILTRVTQAVIGSTLGAEELSIFQCNRVSE